MKKALITVFTLALVISAFNPLVTVGHCTDGAGNGHIDFSTDGIVEPYTYISYEGIAAEDETVITLSLVNPIHGEDDFIFIADYNTNTHTLSTR